MVKVIDPKQTNRAQAFDLWMKSPMPMVTLFKNLDVTNLVKVHQKRGYKFNMLMCWCIGQTASQTEEFYTLPVGEIMMKYDKLAVNTVVITSAGGIDTCDIPFSEDLTQFNQDYLQLTKRVHDTSKGYNLGQDYMIIGTSAFAQYEIDGAVNIYSGIYNNPFMIWGKYKKSFLKTMLKVSFQFHHTQMDGIPAARFLDCLQKEIKNLKI